jgi:hypothetical protein
MSACDCASDWRLEALDLATGTRLGWLPFVSFEFEEVLNDVGQANITMRPEKVDMSLVFPHLRAVAFTRTSGGTATSAFPVCEYIGMIEQALPDSDGNFQIGLTAIEGYLNHRMILADHDYTVDQNNLCSDLVALAASGGIPLTATWDVGAHVINQTYAATDDKMIYPALADLFAADNGPEYTRAYSFASGAWSTNLHFADSIGTDRGKLNARRGLVRYSINVDATNHFNWLRGRGESDVWEDDTFATSPYPRFDAGMQWSDLTNQPVLVRRVNGQLAKNFDPTVLPDVTIANLDLAAKYGIGDTVDVDMNMGALRYSGAARVQRRSWSVAEEQPSLCTLSVVPPDGVLASVTVRNAPRLPAVSGCY